MPTLTASAGHETPDAAAAIGSVDGVLRAAGLTGTPHELDLPTAGTSTPAAHLVDLCDALLAAPAGGGADALADAIQNLGADRVVLIDRDGDRPSTLAAAAPPLPDGLDADLLAAGDEVALQARAIDWPPQSRLDRPARRAIERAAETLAAARMLAVPVTDGTQTVAVALIATPSEQVVAAAALFSPTLGLAIATRRQAEQTVATRLGSQLRDTFTARRRRILLGIAAAIAAVLACPYPYRAACDCRLEPQFRRFVAAPFDGRLAEVLVRPGDVVTAGQPLARLDGEEIAFEQAGLLAERQQAVRERTSALSKRDVAAAQLAALERDRIDARLAVLQDRQNRLTVTAPIAGLVVDGDLDRVRGMPLETGRTLFEVAPLDRVICEVNVPEYDIREVATGQSVAISLDADPWTTHRGTITHLAPRAEDRSGQAAFVAEVELPNPDRTLRPGMTGDAKVATRWHPLGWNWLHRWYGQFRRGW